MTTKRRYEQFQAEERVLLAAYRRDDRDKEMACHQKLTATPASTSTSATPTAPGKEALVRTPRTTAAVLPERGRSVGLLPGIARYRCRPDEPPPSRSPQLPITDCRLFRLPQTSATITPRVQLI